VTGEAASAVDAPHIVQLGDAPIFIGAGDGDLVCRCGASVLISGYLPHNFLAIRIQCFRCGNVTTTPGLPAGEILPREAVGVPRKAQPVLASSQISPHAVLVCEDEIAGYALTRPRNPPTEPMLLSAAMLEQVAAAYDRLTGGLLAEHSAEAERAVSAAATGYPLAWALLRLRDKIDIPGWSWIYQNDDALAAMYVCTMQHWLACWGDDPRLDWIAIPLASPGRYLRTMTVFAAAQLLFASGNRVGFAVPTAAEPDVGLHFSPGGAELSLAVSTPPALQWAAHERWSPQAVYATVTEAVAAAHGRINRARPGVVLLITSILQPNFDQAVVDSIHELFRGPRIRHRRIAAIAAIVPKVMPTQRLDRVGFFYGFYPIENPRFLGSSPVRVGETQEGVNLQPQLSQ